MAGDIRPTSVLLDYLKRVEKRTYGRRAIHAHLSALHPNNRKQHHKKLVNDAFADMIKADKGQVFNMPNDDVIFVYEDRAQDEVDAAKVKMQFIFADDPALQGSGADDFISNYDLQTQFAALVAVAQRLAMGGPNIESGPRTLSGMARPGMGLSNYAPRRKPLGKPLTPAMLAKVEKALSSADFANMIRRQSICAIVGKAAPQVLFDEVFVSIPDLRETLLPEVDFSASPWLFQHMTETLDRRVLSNINKHDDGSLNSDFSINLNVSTVLSSDFLTFDDNINASMRSSIVVEMQMVDIFSDLAAYLLARDFAHDRGYRICIDGLSWETLPYIDRIGLGADLVKLFWMPELAEAIGSDDEIKSHIKRIGTGRVILCRVDDELAVEVGQSAGITLFQGRHVQRMLMSDPRRKRVGSVLVKK